MPTISLRKATRRALASIQLRFFRGSGTLCSVWPYPGRRLAQYSRFKGAVIFSRLHPSLVAVHAKTGSDPRFGFIEIIKPITKMPQQRPQFHPETRYPIGQSEGMGHKLNNITRHDRANGETGQATLAIISAETARSQFSRRNIIAKRTVRCGVVTWLRKCGCNRPGLVQTAAFQTAAFLPISSKS